MLRTIGFIGTASAAVVLAACGSSTATTPTPPANPGGQSTATPAPVQTPTQAPASLNLSGTWTGQYSGPFNGTFSLTWTQTGPALNGTIKLSSPADTLGISGGVTGSTINFGAVGVVTYTGTVSGSTMSGSYIDVANGQSGSWNASKS